MTPSIADDKPFQPILNFWLTRLADSAPRARWLARAHAGIGSRVGKYHVEMDGLESVGARAIVAAVENSNVVVIAEIGATELFSGSFKEAVEKATNCAQLAVGVVHRRTRNNVIDSVKSREDAVLFEVTVENRIRLREVIVKRAIISLVSRSMGSALNQGSFKSGFQERQSIIGF